MTQLRHRYSSLGLAAVVALGLAACGSTTDQTTPAAGSAPSSSSAGASSSTPSSSTSSSDGSSSTAGTTLAVGSTTLGQVVVDGRGRTLYMYGKDTQNSGKSACTGGCLTAWPPVLATGAPTVTGVSGTVGTIDTPDGKKQVTLNGWPLYTYVKDAKAGDTTGQNVGQIWFVLDQTGTPVKSTGGTTTGY
jgi:predicted lipoprotein with Yx(FWY)xxD motif